MKAILTVDIPDDYQEYGSGKWYIKGELLRIGYKEKNGSFVGKKRIENEMVQLKPMPTITRKRFNDLLKKWGWSEQEILMYEEGFDYCVDKISGETKDE